MSPSLPDPGSFSIDRQHPPGEVMTKEPSALIINVLCLASPLQGELFIFDLFPMTARTYGSLVIG